MVSTWIIDYHKCYASSLYLKLDCLHGQHNCLDSGMHKKYLGLSKQGSRIIKSQVSACWLHDLKILTRKSIPSGIRHSATLDIFKKGTKIRLLQISVFQPKYVKLFSSLDGYSTG